MSNIYSDFTYNDEGSQIFSQNLESMYKYEYISILSKLMKIHISLIFSMMILFSLILYIYFYSRNVSLNIHSLSMETEPQLKYSG